MSTRRIGRTVHRWHVRIIATVMIVLTLVVGCGKAEPTTMPVPPTATLISPVFTVVPPTDTPPPTNTPAPPMDTPAVETTPTLTPLPPLTSTDGGVIAFYSDRDGNTEIYTINPDGSNLRRLTNNSAGDMAPAISPDGTRIAFMSASDIYVMNVDGTDPQRLTNTPAYESHPDWSPGGTRIAFVSERDGNREIYIMDADGSNVQRLTDDPADDIRPDWSPDGTRIVFNSERDGNFEIYVMDTDGSNLRRLTDNPKWEMFPQWSPDGTQIAYTFHTPGRWNQEIYVMNVADVLHSEGTDGTDVRQLTNLPAASENPIWSPDGSQIVFQSDRDGNFEIYVMNADGSDQRRLTDNSAGDYWPSWGPLPTQTSEYIHPVSDEMEGLDNSILHTHVCGFLIATSDKRILIDSLFQVDSPPTPAERVLAMQQGLPPFNDIDLILVTHDHEDHFDANLVGNNMLHNPDAVLVSTDVVVNKLDQFSEFERIQDRVIGVRLGRGEREQMNVAGIDLEIVFLSHGVPSVPNFGYYFMIDDISFFHTGDMNPEHVTVSDLQAYGLPEKEIDIAFVSGFRLTDERFSDRILEGIQPKVMVPMHFNFSKTYDNSVFSEVETNFQNAILFPEEMTWQTIDLGMLE